MYSIDEATKRFADAEAGLKANISGHEGKIRGLREREVQLKAEHQAAAAAVAAARTAVPEEQLSAYDRVARRPGQPACVAVTGGRCGGCHMKLSAGREFEARQGENLTTCDQCGRIVYWQA